MLTIYYKPSCQYSVRAIKLAKTKYADIELYDVGLYGGIHNVLNKLSAMVPRSHKTVPIIFLNGKFIGGYDKFELHCKRI